MKYNIGLGVIDKNGKSWRVRFSLGLSKEQDVAKRIQTLRHQLSRMRTQSFAASLVILETMS